MSRIRFIKAEIDNYQYIADFVAMNTRRATPDEPANVLDYGCGSGQAVEMISALGPHIRAFGCDLFQEKPEYMDSVNKGLLTEGRILRMEDESIPFPDEMFDIVISNQVMEHVGDLDLSLSEISRVLRPDGLFLSMFPDKSVWREGHCGVPFVHWIKKGSRFKPLYLFIFRCIGLGFHKNNKTRMQWSMDFTRYLDQWTHYRSYKEIMSIFQKYLEGPVHIEKDYLEKRLGGSRFLPLIPGPLRPWIVRKFGGMVVVFKKNSSALEPASL